MTARRKLLVAGASLPALVWAGASRAQTKPRVVIGWLNPFTRESSVRLLIAFKEGLASHGWKEGTQYVIEERWLDGRMEQLPRMAQELAATKPQVIVTQASPLVLAVAKAAPNTPIVQVLGNSLETGMVASLARPGGMVTGLSNMSLDLIEKVVELLHEAVPKARRVGFLIDPSPKTHTATMENVLRASKQYSIDARFGEVTTPQRLEPVISGLAKDGVQAIILLPGVWFAAERQRIVNYALAHRLPVATGNGSVYVEAGALLDYSPESLALRRRAAYYVDRILKGAKPADLPIEQPTKFEMVINLKTAKALGITIPQSILVRADRVIE